MSYEINSPQRKDWWIWSKWCRWCHRGCSLWLGVENMDSVHYCSYPKGVAHELCVRTEFIIIFFFILGKKPNLKKNIHGLRCVHSLHGKNISCHQKSWNDLHHRWYRCHNTLYLYKSTFHLCMCWNIDTNLQINTLMLYVSYPSFLARL